MLQVAEKRNHYETFKTSAIHPSFKRFLMFSSVLEVYIRIITCRSPPGAALRAAPGASRRRKIDSERRKPDFEGPKSDFERPKTDFEGRKSDFERRKTDRQKHCFLHCLLD